MREREVLCVSKLAYGSCVRVKGCAVQLQNPKTMRVCLLPKFPLSRACEGTVTSDLIVDRGRIASASFVPGWQIKNRVPSGVWKRAGLSSSLLGDFAAEATRRGKKIARNLVLVSISTTAEIHSFSLPLVFSFLNFTRVSLRGLRVLNLPWQIAQEYGDSLCARLRRATFFFRKRINVPLGC